MIKIYYKYCKQLILILFVYFSIGNHFSFAQESDTKILNNSLSIGIIQPFLYQSLQVNYTRSFQHSFILTGVEFYSSSLNYYYLQSLMLEQQYCKSIEVKTEKRNIKRSTKFYVGNIFRYRFSKHYGSQSSRYDDITCNSFAIGIIVGIEYNIGKRLLINYYIGPVIKKSFFKKPPEYISDWWEYGYSGITPVVNLSVGYKF